MRALNDRVAKADGRYILCWLQQALRARDNPVIDASIRLGNALRLPVLVYHGVLEDYSYASDRLHRFILGASRDVGAGCRERGLACVQHVDRAGRREKGLVHRLGAEAAAIVLEDQPTFVARWQAEPVAARAAVPVYAVDAACLVPATVLGDGVRSRSAFLRRHEPERAGWMETQEVASELPAYPGPLPFAPDALDRLGRLVTQVLPSYASARNDATRADGASGLSPYLHFGVRGPREVMTAVAGAHEGGQHKRKLTSGIRSSTSGPRTISPSLSRSPPDRATIPVRYPSQLLRISSNLEQYIA